MSFAARFARLPTAAKLLLILTAVLLPIGIALAIMGSSGIREANAALEGRSADQAQAASRAIESLIARNALAIRIAANGALAGGPAGACDRARASLSIAPAIAQSFELEGADGRPLCATGQVGDPGELPMVPPGSIRVEIAPALNALIIRDGVNGGMATVTIPIDEVRTATVQSGAQVRSLVLDDGKRELHVVDLPVGSNSRPAMSSWPISNGNLTARVGIKEQRITTGDRLVLLLPVLMWVAAALIAWLLVSRLLIRPLKRLERAVVQYRPGEGPIDLPRKL